MSPLEGLAVRRRRPAASRSSRSRPPRWPSCSSCATPSRTPTSSACGSRSPQRPGEDFRYDLSFDEFLTAAFTDEVRTHDGLKVIIPSRDRELLQGAMLDHTETQGLVIRNPNRPAPPVVEGLTSDDELSAEIEAMIANEVNPALAVHGGFVTLRRPRRRGHRLPHDGRRLPRLLDEPADDARRGADDALGGDRGRRAGQGPHRPHDRREPLLQLSQLPGQRLDDLGRANRGHHPPQHLVEQPRRHGGRVATGSHLDVDHCRVEQVVVDQLGRPARRRSTDGGVSLAGGDLGQHRSTACSARAARRTPTPSGSRSSARTAPNPSSRPGGPTVHVTVNGCAVVEPDQPDAATRRVWSAHALATASRNPHGSMRRPGARRSATDSTGVPDRCRAG